jgi:hypothetical protein
MGGVPLASSVAVISSIIISVLLLVASASKMLTFRWFVNTLAKYKLVPARIVGLSAIAVILGELSIGLLILSAWAQPWAAYGAVALFSFFSAALLTNLVRGRVDINCGCFGLWNKDKVGWQLVLRNMGFSGLALLSLWPNRSSDAILPFALFTISLVLIAAPIVVRALHRTHPTTGQATARPY